MDLWYLKINTIKKDTDHGKSYFMYEFNILSSGLPYDHDEFY